MIKNAKFVPLTRKYFLAYLAPVENIHKIGFDQCNCIQQQQEKMLVAILWNLQPQRGTWRCSDSRDNPDDHWYFWALWISFRNTGINGQMWDISHSIINELLRWRCIHMYLDITIRYVVRFEIVQFGVLQWRQQRFANITMHIEECFYVIRIWYDRI